MPVKRVIQGYTKKLVVEKMSSQILLTSNHSKTESYYDLTKDFYLDNLDSR
jgi:hypothetical protein